MHDVGDALVQARLADPVMDMEYITLTYADVYELMRDLKTLGAHNAGSEQRQGLTGKTRLQHMITQYETLRHEDRLPATYEVVYGHAWTPTDEQQLNTDSSRPQPVIITPEDIGRLRDG
jgi:malonyl-CoA O-methyltransferase